MRHFSIRLVRVLAGGILLQAILPAHAESTDADLDDYINPDRPGIADGSNVVGAGRFQIEIGLQQEHREKDHERTIFVPTLMRVGLDRNWEFRVESNVYTRKTHDSTEGVGRREGWSPVSIGMKYHFVDSEGTQRPSVGAILRLFPSSGSGDFRTHHTTGDFRLAADWDFAPEWSLNPNLGFAVYEDEANRDYGAGLLAATLNYNPSKVLNFFVDAGIQSPETKHGKMAVIYDAGVAYVIGHDIQLDFSAGSGAAGATPPHPFLSVGISKRF
jgi:hypothetical protein